MKRTVAPPDRAKETPMQCDLAQELFSDYVSDQIDRAKSVSLENHLQTCDNCREEVAQLRQAWSVLDEMPSVEPPANFHTLVMTRLDEALAYEASAPVETKKPTFFETLRSIFQARNLAFGAVALAILFGAQVAQTNRAAMGPLDFVIRLFHPAQPLKTSKVELSPNSMGGETISVHLQANALSVNGPSKFACKLQLVTKDGKVDTALGTVEKSGELNSQQETVVSLDTNASPSAQDHELKLTLTPTDGGTDTTQTLSLTPGQ